MDEKEQQEEYMEFQAVNQQLKQIEQQLQNLNMQLAGINNIKTSIEELSEVKEGTEVFFTLSPGIYVKGKIGKTDELFVNLGSNIIGEKTIKQTKELLEEQSKKANQYIEYTNKKWDIIYSKLLTLNKHMKNV